MRKSHEKWDSFAVLLIDVQMDFFPESAQEQFPRFRENTEKLISLARQHNIEIIHLHAIFKEDRSDWMARYKATDRYVPCIEGTPGVEVMSYAMAEQGEKIILKQTFDGFCNPTLDAYLQNRGKHFLLVAGLITSVCVLFTSASAIQRGYLVGLLEDCCADKSVSIHNSVLETYSYLFDRVTVDTLFEKYPAWVSQLQSLES